nr:MAG TPA: hypothetical protein [Caudoviricetes sp.]
MYLERCKGKSLPNKVCSPCSYNLASVEVLKG